MSELADLSHQAGPYLATAATSNAFHAAKSKSKAPKVLMGIAAALILVGGIFVAVRVFTGGDDTAAPSTTVATTSTTAGPVLDREGTVVDEDLLSAFTAACLTLEIDGSKAKFCDCAREVVPGQTTKKELEAAIAAFFGIRGSIPPSVQAAMRTCTTRTTSPPGAAPPSGAPPSTTK